MKNILEILRLCWDLKLSHSDTASSLGVAPSTVHRYVAIAKAAGLSWPLPAGLDETDLERLLFPPVSERPKLRAEPDWGHVHTEYKRKGVTLILLWQEYKESHPDDGYQLSQFCDNYRKWRAKLNITMRMNHRAGEKAFSDFAGTTLPVQDAQSGEIRRAHLFVSTLGASSYTYADVFWDESSESWCDGQANAFEYFGGSSEIIVPDNARAAVTTPCRYEPEMNESFRQMAKHFGSAVIPARVRHPKDKAKVESAVGVATRWIIAKLRNRTFFSLEELRQAVRTLLEDLNNRPFKKLPGSRKTAFEALDKPALKPLPYSKYEHAENHKVRVGLDYHIEFEQHWYSVPFQLAKKEVELYATRHTVEVLHKGKRVASHIRSFLKGQTTTVDEHRPPNHLAISRLSKESIVAAATRGGPFTLKVILHIFEMKDLHQQEALNKCQGILLLSRRTGCDRLEAACQRACVTGAISYRSIKSILSLGLDSRPLPAPKEVLIIQHENVRGSDYYKEIQQCC